MNNIISISDAKRFKVKAQIGSPIVPSFENNSGGEYSDSTKVTLGDVDMTREELDAKLAQNKAEVQAIASGMREEMAHWREEQNEQMSKIITTLSVLDVKLDERYENQKQSTSKTQWLIGLTIAVAALVPAFISAIKSDTPTQPTVQPAVIYVQQPNVAEPPQPANNSK